MSKRWFVFEAHRGKTPEEAVQVANAHWRTVMCKVPGQPYQIDDQQMVTISDPALGELYFVLVVRYSRLDVT